MARYRRLITDRAKMLVLCVMERASRQRCRPAPPPRECPPPPERPPPNERLLPNDERDEEDDRPDPNRPPEDRPDPNEPDERDELDDASHRVTVCLGGHDRLNHTLASRGVDDRQLRGIRKACKLALKHRGVIRKRLVVDACDFA